MSLIEAIILGLIQGITEFLPVSSSGHLFLLESLLSVDTKTEILFEVMLHCGTLVAIFAMFKNDIVRMNIELIHIVRDIVYNLKNYIDNRVHETDHNPYRKLLHNNYRKLAISLSVSTLFTAVVGYLMIPFVESMNQSLLTVGLGFLITAVVLLVVDYWNYGERIPKDITIGQAVVLGICQGLGTFPGVSSLGITITCGLLFGFKKNFAIRYAILLSIPATIGALIMEAGNFTVGGMSIAMITIYVVGMIIAAISGYFCIRYVLKFVQQRGFRIFAAYSFLTGIAAIICYFKIAA